MRPVRWLHISDIHLRVRDAWSQDVVLTAMCDRVNQLRTNGIAADFILLTGDLAFSGKPEEYALANDFLDALVSASGVPNDRIFCIPGNHDIDRDRQRMCFQGTRDHLHDQTRIDAFLSAGDDLETLLKRQEAYRDFQRTRFQAQHRISTEDGLGYVSHLNVDDLQLAIVALDSAWLAQGGLDDHGNLLIGERQVINALRLAQESADKPHVVIGMAHHPLHLLRECDRHPTLTRIERNCHFFHCGHLHAPEARPGGHNGAGCLTLAAGASFETRQTHNAFSVITLDLLQAKRTVKTLQYRPDNGTFSYEANEEYVIEIAAPEPCGVAELGQALALHRKEQKPIAYYLAALLCDKKGDVPIPSGAGYTFGSLAVFQGQPDSELRQQTLNFMAFRNVLRALYPKLSPSTLLERHGDAVAEYGAALLKLGSAQPDVGERLAQHEADAQTLARSDTQKPFSHTMELFSELAAQGEWGELQAHAQRHLDVGDPVVVIQAERMLALALANSSERADKEAAVKRFGVLAAGSSAEPSDFANQAMLHLELEAPDESKRSVLQGIERFPASHADYFSDMGQKIVAATGDKAFRAELTASVKRKKGK